ncbi:MAG: thiamine pyrophosphate-dependent enzyme [Actinomycetota bacterium]
MSLTKDSVAATGASRLEEVSDFRTGNDMAAIAARHVDFHLMGYYPITPSTEVCENIDEDRAAGRNRIRMVPAEGEHSAAGICYGASLGEARVINATSAQGLLYMLEQLPVQSGTRFPMVLDLSMRSISGPLDIRCDHSDMYFALNTGWIILLARGPQAVYDMNILAVRLGEHPEVRLPVIVAYDGFVTSHQKRRVRYFADAQAVRSFVGPVRSGANALDPRRPITIGAYMNDPDLVNNHYQLHLAMEKAREIYDEVVAEYSALTGRSYPAMDLYRMDDAEVGLFLLTTAAETAKDACDRLRQQGVKAGVISPNVVRPFPAELIRQACRNVKVLVVGERADSYGSGGGNLSHEVKSALKEDAANRTVVISRVFGLGGREFFLDDAEAFFRLGLDVVGGASARTFDYFGQTPGDPDASVGPGLPAIPLEAVSGRITTTLDPDTGFVQVKTPPVRQLAEIPKRIAPGHGACPGCGIFGAVDQFLKGIEGHVVLLSHTGCSEIVTSGFPYSSHRVTYVHNLFQSGAATLSGLVEVFKEKQARGEIPSDEEITFVMLSGDGGMDIGLGSALGAAVRNHGMIILEYDNQGYMNTGHQLSYSTPFAHQTNTSHIGPGERGKAFHHRDTPGIMAATGIPYVFTGVESLDADLVRKAAKAQWYAKHEGMAYGKLLIACPLNWKAEDNQGRAIVQAAVDCCFFPLYEVEKGVTRINYDPEAKGKRVPVAEWLKYMGKTRHLLRPDYEPELREIEAEIERRWVRLKARNESPLL